MEVTTAMVSMSLADWNATMRSLQERDERIESLDTQIGILQDDLSELRDELAKVRKHG